MQGRIKTLTNIRLDRNKASADMGDLLAGDIVEWMEEYTGLDGLIWAKLTRATHNGAPVRCTDGSTVAGRYAWVNNIEETTPTPQPVVTLTHNIEVYSDGSIRIDGQPVA